MHLEVTFKNLRPRDEIRDRAEVLYAKLERFLEPAAQSTRVVAVEHGQAVVELVVTTYGETHTVIEEQGELRTALDKLFHTMDLRLRRAKERRADHHRAEAPAADGFAAAAAEPPQG